MTRRSAAIRATRAPADGAPRLVPVAPSAPPPARLCDVTAVAADEGAVEVVHAASGWRGRALPAAGYAPSVGDRVVVTAVDGASYVTAVVACARAPEIRARDGATARAIDDGLELRDARGRLLVRYVDGRAVIEPPEGDLALCAPAGRVTIEAASDVSIAAARDVTVVAQRSLESRAGGDAPASGSKLRLEVRGAKLSAPELDVRARVAKVATGDATVLARSIQTSAVRIATTVDELTVTAGRVVERAREALSEVAELLETRAGRVRTLVRDLYALRSRRTTIKSTSDTAIDGRRVLLG